MKVYCISLIGLTTLLAMAPAVTRAETAAASSKEVKAVMQTYCFGCHGPKKQKGKVRLDVLDMDVVHGKDAEVWQDVLDVLNLGEMPPEKKKQPTTPERRKLIKWLTTDLKKAADFKRANTRVVLRRMTKSQYTHALQDLLQLDVDFGQDLPDDGLSTDGFKNNGEEQVISLLQTEYYLDIAQRALDKAIISDKSLIAHRHTFLFGKGLKGKKHRDYKKKGKYSVPVSTKDHQVATFVNPRAEDPKSKFIANEFWKGSWAELRGAKNKRFSVQKDGILLQPALPNPETGEKQWLSPAPSLKLQMRNFPTAGPFVLRVKAAKANAKDKDDPYLKALVGERLDHGHDYKTFEEAVKVTGTRNKFQTIEFRGRLENFPVPVFDAVNKDENTMLIVGVWNDNLATNKKAMSPAVIVKSLEFECGTYESWPPASQRAIFIKSRNTGNEATYSREIIEHFMTSAFRRSVSQNEVAAYHNLWKTTRPQCSTFEQSIRETLASVLISPHFLYLVETPSPKQKKKGESDSKKITEFQLAARMSFLLWNSIPDKRLFELASKNKLRVNLKAEFQRMLKDPRSMRFIETFCSEWLQIEKMLHTNVDKKKFQSFNRFVRSDMIRETQLFFAEVFYKNMNILTLIDSDFTMLNQNLAQFYGLNNVKGAHFRKVSLKKAHNRGGLLSQGLFLTGNSNGVEAHPVKRGTWLTSRILDDPPPPPPPNVPQIDEDDPAFAKLSIHQQLAKHRDNPSCADCHRKIDPWGLLFENYDAIGRWENKGKGAAKATLANGKTLDGVAELKRYLQAEKKEQFARGLVRNLLRFGLGRHLSFTDNAAIDDILKQVKQDEYKAQTLLFAVISSPLFSAK